MNKALVLPIVLMTLQFGSTAHAFCSCKAKYSDLRERADANSFAFTAEVIKAGEKEAQLQVKDVYKGSASGQLTIPKSGSDCYETPKFFKQGKTYLFTTSQPIKINNGVSIFKPSSCGDAIPIEKAQGALQWLPTLQEQTSSK